ncbi:MAG: twin-arginine translocase TatA/TatE family subunit [Anaerolineaceae bacterium]
MLGSVGLPEVILIAVVVILIFGVGRISKIGGELGSGIRAFKEGMSGEKDEPKNDEKVHDQDIPKPN